MSATPLDNFMVADESRIVGEINRIGRVRGRVSALMEKDLLPEGMGYNYESVVYDRSGSSGGAGWQNLAEEDGTLNNCVPDPGEVNSAITRTAFTAQVRLEKSEPICFLDARNQYMFQKQITAKQDNFAGVIADIWEERDKSAFFTLAGHKMVFDGALTESTGATMPLSVPTSRITQDLLDYWYTRLIQDGYGEEAYAMSNGKPLVTAIMSSERQRDIIKADASTRQDFQYADMGQGDKATLLRGWGIDKAYSNFLQVIDDRMPRYDFIGGAWVERPFYANEATTIGDKQVVAHNYRNAMYEDIYLWHPKVAKRLTPKPIGSVGGMTSGEAVNYNGDVLWRNILSETENPLGNIGRYWAALCAAYEPSKRQYGVVIRVLRCNIVNTLDCSY